MSAERPVLKSKKQLDQTFPSPGIPWGSLACPCWTNPQCLVKGDLVPPMVSQSSRQKVLCLLLWWVGLFFNQFAQSHWSNFVLWTHMRWMRPHTLSWVSTSHAVLKRQGIRWQPSSVSFLASTVCYRCARCSFSWFLWTKSHWHRLQLLWFFKIVSFQAFSFCIFSCESCFPCTTAILFFRPVDQWLATPCTFLGDLNLEAYIMWTGVWKCSICSILVMFGFFIHF